MHKVIDLSFHIKPKLSVSKANLIHELTQCYLFDILFFLVSI